MRKEPRDVRKACKPQMFIYESYDWPHLYSIFETSFAFSCLQDVSGSQISILISYSAPPVLWLPPDPWALEHCISESLNLHPITYFEQ